MIPILLVMAGACLIIGVSFFRAYKIRRKKNQNQIDERSDTYFINAVAFSVCSGTLLVCAKCIFLYEAITKLI